MFKRNEKIGPYIVEFPIKEGRQAESYRVTDGNVTYFLKLIDHSKLDETQTNDKGQLWEVEILKSLSHPNIVKYHDSCDIDIDGKKYTMIVTNFISGETVAQRMARKQGCSVYEAKRIIIAVLKAVAYMHEAEHPVIHNELTVQNVMIDMSGREEVARVIGFGYARMPNGNHKSIFCRNDLNPFYLAPEVFDGKCTEQSDVFSVGSMLYHVLFGLPPYFTDISLKKWDNDSLKAAISKEREKPLRILERNKFDLSQHLLDILNKALAVDPENRYKTAQEFLLDITEEDSIKHQQSMPKEDEVQNQNEKHILHGNGFADVAGLNELKARMQNEVINLVRNPEKYKKLRVKIPNGFHLYGPPGCGKTFIGEKLAEEIGWNYVYVHCSDVASPYIHGGQEKIAALFNRAKEQAPTIIFLDEIDALIADRSKHTNVSEYGEVNEFLTQLNNCSENHILVIAATNNPKAIDPAALRAGRLEIKMFVPAPDLEERVQLFKLSLKDRGDDNIDYEKLAKLTENYVCKDIDQLVNRAALQAANLDLESIPMDILIESIQKYKNDFPSVPIDVLKKFDDIKAEFEGKSSSRPHVGFK